MASVVTEVSTSWITQKTWSTGELVTASNLNTYLRDGMGALKNPAYFKCEIDEASNYTTTSTTFADIDATNLAPTITTGGGVVELHFIFTAKNSTANEFVQFTFDVDGSPVAGDDGIASASQASLDTGGIIHLSWLVTGLSAGAHTFKPQWKVSGGTGTLFAGAGTADLDVHPIFWGMER